MVYRDTSPEEYWTIIGICIFGGLAGIAIGIQQSFEVINGYKKKIAAQKEMKQLDKRHDS